MLPVAAHRAEEPVLETPEALAELDLTDREVLLVEDDSHVREWLLRTLNRLGYHVRSASNGDQALSLTSDWTPDAVVTDIVMAGSRGTEMALTLRERFPLLPVVFISGYADTEVSEWHALASEQTGFLAKPFRADELDRELRRVLHSGAALA